MILCLFHVPKVAAGRLLRLKVNSALLPEEPR